MTDEAKVPDVIQGALVPSPVFRGAAMVKALQDYRELQAALDKSMPDQIMDIGNKQFRKKGYWRAIAVAFSLSIETEREERAVVGTLGDGTENYVYSVTCRALAPNGRQAIGDGMCAASEKQKGRMEATEHNVRSHAFTRAFNRAVSNLVGFGEVSAEEVERDEHAPTLSTAPERADGAAKVVKVQKSTGTNKKSGKAWAKYLVTFDDGRSGSTFDGGLAEAAQEAAGTDALMIPTLEQVGQFTNLIGLVPAESSPPAASTNGDPGDKPVDSQQVGKLWAIARAHGWDKAPDDFAALVKSFGYERVQTKHEDGSLTVHVRQRDYGPLLNALKQRAIPTSGDRTAEPA